MGWSWHDLQATPPEVIDVVTELFWDEQDALSRQR
jgi:hypothetical protein